MGMYQKLPVIIEANQFDGFNDVPGVCFKECIDKENVWLIPHVHTLEGIYRARKSDWIIKGVSDEYYPCRDDIFRSTYEAVNS